MLSEYLDGNGVDGLILDYELGWKDCADALGVAQRPDLQSPHECTMHTSFNVKK